MSWSFITESIVNSLWRLEKESKSLEKEQE